MSKETKKKAKASQSLLSKKTVSLIQRGIVNRDKIIVLACLDVVKALPTAGRNVVRTEIKAIDPGFSINNDSLQAVLNALRNDKAIVQETLLKICTRARIEGNKAKAKSKAKAKAKAKAGGKAKAGKDTGKAKAGKTYQDSILNLPLPKEYGDMQELVRDYNYLANWLAVAEALLRKEKLIK